MKPVIYVTRKIPEKVLKPYRSHFDVRMWEAADEPVPRDVLLKEIQDADGLLCLLTEQIDRELLEHGEKLKIVANMAVGFDNVDVAAAKERGVMVTNTPDVLTDTTADLTFALLMAAARRIVEASEYIKSNAWENWSPYLLAGADVHHKTIGIVGMGRIGQAVAKRAKGFDMHVMYHARSRKPDAEREIGAVYKAFDELLAESDFVVCLVPLTNQTADLFNREAFRKMKNSAVFVNVSRGGTVDEDALYDALTKGEIRAAGLDVFKGEPIGAEHPLVQLDNVAALPHIGSASEETRSKMLTLCLDNVTAVFNGEKPLTPVSTQ
ncbi:2-hydroxyacid dehydrogenase [Virgibacillus siamensis]|uniref:2-hydroxyacid dehydrogenase n=1 Tax=Virgibacillus siamensis TaxID=480071 RepID=UPI000986AF35|nr:D-glycerate dehydrogenase [Virgibacillus siamensis]